jgi:hypothetical protein
VKGQSFRYYVKVALVLGVLALIGFFVLRNDPARGAPQLVEGDCAQEAPSAEHQDQPTLLAVACDSGEARYRVLGRHNAVSFDSVCEAYPDTDFVFIYDETAKDGEDVSAADVRRDVTYCLQRMP